MSCYSSESTYDYCWISFLILGDTTDDDYESIDDDNFGGRDYYQQDCMHKQDNESNVHGGELVEDSDPSAGTKSNDNFGGRDYYQQDGMHKQDNESNVHGGELVEDPDPSAGTKSSSTETLDSIYLHASSDLYNDSNDDPFLGKMGKCTRVAQCTRTSKFVSELKKEQEKMKKLEKNRRKKSDTPGPTHGFNKIKHSPMAVQVSKDIVLCSIQ